MIKKIIKRIIIQLIYMWGCLFYDKKYLQGRCFDRNNLTEGWFWIMRCWYQQRVRGINSHVPWPVSENVLVGDPNNIEFDVDYMRNFFSNGCYYQAIGAKLHIGKRTLIAPGVGLITGNHNINDMSSHTSSDIYIGEDCWIGMNAVILPGVTLGNHTVVGAGAVVTKSVPEGFCVLVGNPAKVIKKVLINDEGEIESVKDEEN